MKPAVFSVNKNNYEGIGWTRQGDNINYQKNKI